MNRIRLLSRWPGDRSCHSLTNVYRWVRPNGRHTPWRNPLMTSVTRTFASIIVACAAAGVGTAALAADKAQTSTAAATTQSTDWAQQRKDRIQRRLDSAATRLEIKASQQSAWQAYAAAVKDLADIDAACRRSPRRMPTRPPSPASVPIAPRACPQALRSRRRHRKAAGRALHGAARRAHGAHAQHRIAWWAGRGNGYARPCGRRRQGRPSRRTATAGT